MFDPKMWMAKAGERFAVLNSGYQHKVFSTAVNKATITTVGTITLTKGLWLVVSVMKINNAGSSAYNHYLDGQITRNTEINGGGNVNVIFKEVTSASQKVDISIHEPSFATTAIADVYAIKLGGG